jgi:hypothetical protein
MRKGNVWKLENLGKGKRPKKILRAELYQKTHTICNDLMRVLLHLLKPEYTLLSFPSVIHDLNKNTEKATNKVMLRDDRSKCR